MQQHFKSIAMTTTELNEQEKLPIPSVIKAIDSVTWYCDSHI